MAEKKAAGAFVYEPAGQKPAGSVLYNEHLKLTDKSHIAEFAGYLMPLWYSSISEEHAAVRQRAGIFDCTHMGALEVSGKNAELFLNAVTTNNVCVLKIGIAQYGYILDAAGNVLDDIIIYRRGPEKFMVVVNASNEPKIKAYLAALRKGEASTDGRQIEFASLRDMRDTNPGAPGDCRVDIALQGPGSVEVLSRIDKAIGKRAGELKSFTLFEEKLAGVECIISRTGYTGAKVCFELFVHPDNAAKLWQKVIEAGALPCGLGARDSLRVEAGLPLYGHELDGRYNISPFEAGYGWAVKLEKEFFIGKCAMERIAQTWHGLPAREDTARMAVPPMKVARIELSGEKGVRPVRQNDGIIINGVCIGWVLSSSFAPINNIGATEDRSATAGSRQIALVYMEKDEAIEGNSAGVYYLARSESQKSKGKKESVKRGEKLSPDIAGKIISRFEKF